MFKGNQSNSVKKRSVYIIYVSAPLEIPGLFVSFESNIFILSLKIYLMENISLQSKRLGCEVEIPMKDADDHY